jgi:Delta3-Delta2-enoyl-CoA isomerase
VEVEVRGDVWVLHMGEGENRFNRESVAAIHAVLDRVEASEGPVALVTTGGGRFYSNGLDLDWLLAGEDTEGFLDEVHRMFGRVLGLDCYTVAAVNGHAFAGGAMLAAVHDLVLMREDRGYWCLPEVDLGLPLTPEMYAALSARLPRPALADAILTGRRLTAPEAAHLGLVATAVSQSELLDRAVAEAAQWAGKDRGVIGRHKELLFGDSIRACGAGSESALPGA